MRWGDHTEAPGLDTAGRRRRRGRSPVRARARARAREVAVCFVRPSRRLGQYDSTRPVLQLSADAMRQRQNQLEHGMGHGGVVIGRRLHL